jgi:hypothetical protein
MVPAGGASEFSPTKTSISSGFDHQVAARPPVYIDPEAAMLLEDKLLDADSSGEEVRFALRRED